MNKTINYNLNEEVWLWRSDIQGWTKGYFVGHTKKRISAWNYTLDRVGHYRLDHVKKLN